MKKLKIGIMLALLLTATTAVAKDKTAVCHVGSEEGLNGETYDPNCVPSYDNQYFCPDAGKVDLIEVGNANAHLNNPGHSWNGISDYLPPDTPIGVGKEDADGDYIDDGCDDFFNPPTCVCFAGIPYLEPYNSYGQCFITAPGFCDVANQQNPYTGCSDTSDFDNGQTVNVNIDYYCDGSIRYSCSGPSGFFNLTAQEYAICQSGPGWDPTPN